jgi:hypothetical protein
MTKKSAPSLAPIVLCVYDRIDTLRLTIDALKKNIGANESFLYIFSDGYKSEIDMMNVIKVREFISCITGFQRVEINIRHENMGLARSVIDGVSSVLQLHGNAIVLEDDLVTSTNFLSFMNKALNYFEGNKNVFSISGYSPPITTPFPRDIYFTKRASSWGWATWEDRWTQVDWEVCDYDAFRNDRRKQREFNRMGSDMSKMLKAQMTGRINSWAIRWTYWQFKQDTYSVFPIVSKVNNIGTSSTATNTRDSFSRFSTTFDRTGKLEFLFGETPKLEPRYLSSFLKPNSFSNRLKYKLLNTFFRGKNN